MPEQHLGKTNSAPPDRFLWRFLISVSRALDLSYTGIMSHHMRVAVITSKISRVLGLSQERIDRAAQAALIHDLGVKTWGDRAKLHRFEVDDPYRHALDGCRILTGVGAHGALRDAEGTGGRTLFLPHADIILHHHDRWEGGNPTGAKQDAIPIEARIIHLADRVDVLLDERSPFSSQKEKILGVLEGQRGKWFDPGLIDAVSDLAKIESFWFDLEQGFLSKSLEVCAAQDLSGVLEAERASSDGSDPSFLDTLEVLAWVFAEVVDRRSPYTQAHSRAVGECAYVVGKCLSLGEPTCRELRVAGLLHDLGKLGVPEDILDKNGSLTDEEMCIIKRHPYLTYHLLDGIPGFCRIKKWASFHHERMDGQGYPFRLDSSALPLEARIVAVCDVFSALYEDRPYRPGLSREEVQRIITKMAENGALDREVTDLAGDVMWGVSDLVAAADTAGIRSGQEGAHAQESRRHRTRRGSRRLGT